MMKRRRDGSACQRRWQQIAWAVAAVSADARPITRYGSGSVTYVSDIARAGCGFLSWPRMAETEYAAVIPPPGDMAAAGNGKPARWASACGRCARVWCDDDRLCPSSATTTTTTSAVVYIVEDQRTRWHAPPSSSNADLNLSPRVFQNLTGSAAGRVPVRWRFVDCPPFRHRNDDADGAPTSPSLSPVPSPSLSPVPSPTTAPTDDMAAVGCAVCVRNDSSVHFVSLQPVNDTLGVASLRVDGVRATRPSGSLSFFFSIADQLGRLNLTRLEISLTTRSRRRFTRVVVVKPGACVDIRRADEVSVGGGHDSTEGPTPTLPSSTGNPSGSSDEDGGGGDDGEGEGDEGVATLPPPPATRTPAHSVKINNGSFVVLPSRLPATNGPPAPLIVVPSASFPSPIVSPVVPSITPTAIGKDGGWPTQDPGDTGRFGSGSDMRSRSPPQGATPAPSSPPSAEPPPQPTTGGRTPVGHLSGGVLTNPVFVGVLLGTVGLVGAVVAYRAKATQGARLALVPPVTTVAAGAVSTSRAATYVSATATPRRADVAAL